MARYVAVKGWDELPTCPCDLADWVNNIKWFNGPCRWFDGIPSRDEEYEQCVENKTRPDWCPLCIVEGEEVEP